MSVQAMSWVIKHAPQKGSELLCLMMIADHADPDGRNAYPSIKTLAKHCRMSERQVNRIVVHLEHTGAILVDRSSGRHSNVYTVAMKSANPDATTSGFENANPDNLTGLNHDILSELKPPTLTSGASNPDKSDANPDMAMSYEPIEPKRTNPQPTAAGSVREEIAETATVDEPPPDVIATAEALALAPWMSASLADVTRQVQRSLGLVSAFDPRDGPLEAEKFALYHARKPPKSWYTAWLNWIRNAVRYEQEQQSRTVPNPGQSRGTGQAARTGGAMVGSTAAGVESDIQRRGYSYDEVARRRRESRLAGENQHTADGSKAAS